MVPDPIRTPTILNLNLNLSLLHALWICP
jgi:hypothetical protein